MEEIYRSFATKHLNAEYCAINQYAKNGWKTEITLDGHYDIETLQRVIDYARSIEEKK